MKTEIIIIEDKMQHFTAVNCYHYDVINFIEKIKI